jgi:hypothetical protein
MALFCVLAVAGGAVSCRAGGRRGPENADKSVAPGECWPRLHEQRRSVQTLRALLNVTYRPAPEEAEETVRVVVLISRPDRLVLDVLDPLGRSAVTLLRTEDGIWWRSRRETGLPVPVVALGREVSPADLAAFLLGLPLPDFSSEWSAVARKSPPTELPGTSDAEPGHSFWSKADGRLAGGLLAAEGQMLSVQYLLEPAFGLIARYPAWTDTAGRPHPREARFELHLETGEYAFGIACRKMQFNPAISAELFDVTGFELLAP